MRTLIKDKIKGPIKEIRAIVLYDSNGAWFSKQFDNPIRLHKSDFFEIGIKRAYKRRD